MAVKGAVMVPHPPVIIPEIGHGEEQKIRETSDSYRKAAAKIAGWKPETVVVISPHSVMYADYFHISPGTGAQGDFGQFRASQVKFQVDYDTEFVKVLAREAEARIFRLELWEKERRGWITEQWCPCTFWTGICRITGLCASASRDCRLLYIMSWVSVSGRQRSCLIGMW